MMSWPVSTNLRRAAVIGLCTVLVGCASDPATTGSLSTDDPFSLSTQATPEPEESATTCSIKQEIVTCFALEGSSSLRFKRFGPAPEPIFARPRASAPR